MADTQDVQTQAAQAADAILLAIASLELAPGQTYTERELAALVGLGKVPVREGLLRLAWTGLLFPRTGSGYTVSPISLRGVRDLFSALKLIEPAALELATGRTGRAEHTKQLRKDLTATKHDPAKAELQVHFSLAALSGNQHLMRVQPEIELARLVNLTGRMGEPVWCGAKAHDRLLRLVEAGDPTAPSVARENLELLEHRVLDSLMSAQALQFVNLGER